MITINGLLEDYEINVKTLISNELLLKIIDYKNNVMIKGVPIKFKYFIGEIGKYEFKAVFEKYTAENVESKKKGDDVK